MKVIGRYCRGKAGLFGRDYVVEQLARPELFMGRMVSELNVGPFHTTSRHRRFFGLRRLGRRGPSVLQKRHQHGRQFDPAPALFGRL